MNNEKRSDQKKKLVKTLKQIQMAQTNIKVNFLIPHKFWEEKQNNEDKRPRKTCQHFEVASTSVQRNKKKQRHFSFA